jgi:hypothetical protein
MRQTVGIILVALGALPLAFLPPVVVWAVLECGPGWSYCRGLPGGLGAAAAIGVALVAVGALMLKRPRYRPPQG